MMIFRAHIVAFKDGSVFKSTTMFGTLETFDNYVDLLREYCFIAPSDIKVTVKEVGSLEDVD